MSYETELEIGLKENAAEGLTRLGGMLLGLDHNASTVAKSLQGLIGKGNEAKEAMRLLKIAAIGVAEIEIGKKMIASLDEAIDKAKELGRIHNTLTQIGQGGENKIYDEQARRLTLQFKNLSITELVKGMQEAGPIIGFDKAGTEFGPIADFMSTMKAKFGAEGGGEINRQVQAAVKAAEESGAMRPEDVAKFLQGEQRMLFAFGDQVSPSSMLTVQRNLGAYQKDLDDHFRFGILPAMAINQGQRAGTEIATTASKFVAGIRNSTGSLEEMQRLGIIGEDDLEYNKAGHPIRIKVGHKTALADDMDKDPLKAVTQDLLPRIMARYGSDPTVLKQAVGRLAGDKSAISGIVDLIINAQRYEKDAANVERVNPNFEGYRERSSDYAEQSVKAQRENIETALGLPALGPYTEALNLFAKAEAAVGQAALSHPDLTKFATGILGIGGAAAQFAGIVTELYAGFKLTQMLKSMKAEAEAARKAAADALNLKTPSDIADKRAGSVADTARGAEAARAAPEVARGGVLGAVEGGFARAAADFGTIGMLAWWASQSDIGKKKLAPSSLAQNPLGITLPGDVPHPDGTREGTDRQAVDALRRNLGIPKGINLSDDGNALHRGDEVPAASQSFWHRIFGAASAPADEVGQKFGALTEKTGFVLTSFDTLGTKSGSAVGSVSAFSQALDAATARVYGLFGGAVDGGPGGTSGVISAAYTTYGGDASSGSGIGTTRFGKGVGSGSVGNFSGSIGDGSAVDRALGMVGAREGDAARSLGHIMHAGEWCADFTNSMIEHAGGRGSGSAMARSFMNWGKGVGIAQIQKGDVAVLNGGGHVGFFTGERRADGRLGVVAGNTRDGHGGHDVEHYFVSPGSVYGARRGLPNIPAAPRKVSPGVPASQTTAMNMPPVEVHLTHMLDGKLLAKTVTKHQAVAMRFPRNMGGPDNHGTYISPGTPVTDAA